MKNSKGQNLMEYILLVTAVLIVCIYFFTIGPMRQGINTGLNSVVNEINNVNGALQFK
jgi:uncharacterized protein (UPF0333 family)